MCVILPNRKNRKILQQLSCFYLLLSNLSLLSLNVYFLTSTLTPLSILERIILGYYPYGVLLTVTWPYLIRFKNHKIHLKSSWNMMKTANSLSMPFAIAYFCECKTHCKCNKELKRTYTSIKFWFEFCEYYYLIKTFHCFISFPLLHAISVLKIIFDESLLQKRKELYQL